ncbi:MAG: tetratricopeptide repeat protein [Chlorobi bacterium CHB2]|nr:tetratricopeptide repeat protein [Chlorobi bacterium CHB2]
MSNTKWYPAIAALLLLPVVLPQSKEASKDRANEYFQQGAWEQAATEYQALLTADPQFRQGWFRLGYAEHSLGNFAAAATAYQKAIELGAPPIAHYNLACSYSRQGEQELAVATLEKALNNGYSQQTSLASDPDFASLVNNPRFKELDQKMLLAALPCQHDPRYREFDFWIGEWDVFNTAGQKVGTNSVQQILGSCVLLENWTSASGSQGKSFNTFNRSTGKWQQTWVDDQGTVLELAGNLKGAVLSFEGITRDTAGKETHHRLTFTQIDPNTVRQLWEQSSDKGVTWNSVFDGKYVRKK